MLRIQLILVSLLLVGLLSSCRSPNTGQVILEGSAAGGNSEEWKRFLKVIETFAISSKLTPMTAHNRKGCQGWSIGTHAPDRFVVFACPQHTVEESRYETAALVVTESNWWNPFSGSRTEAMRADLYKALRGEFGNRIKVLE